jgi:hypothetical protein
MHRKIGKSRGEARRTDRPQGIGQKIRQGHGAQHTVTEVRQSAGMREEPSLLVLGQGIHGQVARGQVVLDGGILRYGVLLASAHENRDAPPDPRQPGNPPHELVLVPPHGHKIQINGLQAANPVAHRTAHKIKFHHSSAPLLTIPARTQRSTS